LVFIFSSSVIKATFSAAGVVVISMEFEKLTRTQEDYIFNIRNNSEQKLLL